MRAGIVRACAAGVVGVAVAKLPRPSPRPVTKGRRRFASGRRAGAGCSRRYAALAAALWNPPDKARGLCRDEKRQSQARERTHRAWPLNSGPPETRPSGSRPPGRHRGLRPGMARRARAAASQAPDRRLACIGFRRPLDRGVHRSRDHSGAHQTAQGKPRRFRYPLVQGPCMPTDRARSSLVERFFARWPAHQGRRGRHRSDGPLERALWDDLTGHHAPPTPFCWTTSADEVSASVNRVLQVMNRTTHQAQDL